MNKIAIVAGGIFSQSMISIRLKIKMADQIALILDRINNENTLELSKQKFAAIKSRSQELFRKMEQKIPKGMLKKVSSRFKTKP